MHRNLAVDGRILRNVLQVVYRGDSAATTSLNAEGEFLSMLKEDGRRAADAFLTAHGADLGKRSTADLDALLAEV